MFPLIHTVLGKITSLLFPEKCLSCQAPKTFLCETCRRKTKQKNKEIISLPFLDKLIYWGDYQDKILREALRRFKYHGTYGLAHPLAQMLKELIQPYLSSFKETGVIVPIPAHPWRQRERGYNQAGLLAESLAQTISLPSTADVLIKTRNTPSQISLKGRERLLNIRDSFGIKNQEQISGRDIILVDDISTTGATLNEAARMLKKAGAKKIIGLVVARG